MNKEKIYTIIKNILPPIFFNFLIRSFVYRYIKTLVAKILPNKYNPSWKQVRNGLLSGINIYTTEGSPIDDMFEKNHDTAMFAFIKEGMNIFDVGAHVGYDSMCFSKISRTGKIVSYEPNIFNLERMKLILSKNKDLESNIIINNIALSDTQKHVDFIFTDNIEGGTSSGSFTDDADTLFPKDSYEKLGGFRRVQVKTDSLDNQIHQIGIKPDVIKIDVEGAESAVLNGAKETLKDIKPLLLIEIHSIKNMFDVYTILIEYNYKIEIIKQEKDGRCFIKAE
ncbi:MAG: hypothetical protein RLZZ517_527 [Candidatus Parcubacteria bacterium]